MKKLFPLFVCLTFISLLAVSCRKEGCTDETATNYSSEAKRDDGSCRYLSYTEEETSVNGQAAIKYTGSIDRSMTWENDSVYLLSGIVYITNESTLSLAAGVKVYADPSVYTALVVERGSKINFQGQANLPIVFSSAAAVPAPGDWGGLIINGYATANSGSAYNTGEGFGAFGGSLDNDHSGILNYVRIEYAGKNNTAAFSFRAVGAPSKLDYLQAWHCAASGFEFLGGTVNADHLLAYVCGDEGVDWNFGWRGKGTYWHIAQSGSTGDHGIHGSNNPNDGYLLPYSFPELSHIVLTGRDTAAHTNGIYLSSGSKALFTNVSISNFYRGVEVFEDATLANVTFGDIRTNQLTVTGALSDVLYSGTPDGLGGVIDPILVANAYASGNITNDGGAFLTNWLSGTWYRTL